MVEVLRELEEEMQEAASKLEFEKGALLRDQIMELKKGATSDKEVSAMNAKPMRATYSRPSERESYQAVRNGRGPESQSVNSKE